MEQDVSLELLEKRDAITNDDGHNRIPDFIRQLETKAFSGEHAASNEPDGAEGISQAPIHELREIARTELDGISSARQLATGENENRFVAYAHPNPLVSKLNAVSYVREPMT